MIRIEPDIAVYGRITHGRFFSDRRHSEQFGHFDAGHFMVANFHTDNSRHTDRTEDLQQTRRRVLRIAERGFGTHYCVDFNYGMHPWRAGTTPDATTTRSLGGSRSGPRSSTDADPPPEIHGSLAGVSTRTHTPVAVALAVCAGALAAGACGGGDAAGEGGTGDRGSQDTVIVDEARGAVGVLRLGDARAQVRRRVGPARCTEGGLIAPLGQDDTGIPYSGANYQPRDTDGPYKQCGMRYPRLAVTVFLPDGAVTLVTTDPRARTRRGVGIGDSADLVKERYPGTECRDSEGGSILERLRGSEGTVPAGCLVPPTEGSDGVAPLLLSFGLNDDDGEVSSIWLEATSWQGIKALRRR